ncbi:MAG: efflux RND transporter periplasmic adaptor subunit [Pirellulaceae bacterium]
MKPWSHFDSLRSMRSPTLWIAYGVVAVAVGAAGMYLAVGQRGPAAAVDEAVADAENEGHDGESAKTVHLSEVKQGTAGIRVEPAQRGDLTTFVRVTGKIALNEDRETRIHPLVEGRVHKVNVQFGDRVKAGDVLAVVDSQQIGRAKLDLYKSIKETRLAEVNSEWQLRINKNTQALILDLEKEMPITEIETKYPDLPMGEYRQELLSGYAELHKARSDQERLADVSGQGIVAGKQLIAAQAVRDAAQATFSAAMEKIKFTAARNELSAKQELEKAQTTEAINREILGILGFRAVNAEDIDPAVQKETISHYEVTAPFDGTVISRDVVLLDQVDPGTQMFTVADFSTVWLKADVYEKHLPLLGSLASKTIQFRADSYPDRMFEATVFYTGDIVDEKTRTADMRAIAQNPEGLLKPGLFVELQLPAQAVPDMFQLPSSAIQEHEGKKFVFVQIGDSLFERRDIRVGRTSDDAAEITAGVKEGEQVVVEGAFALKSEMLSELIGEEE